MLTKLSTATVTFHKIAYFSHNACAAHGAPSKQPKQQQLRASRGPWPGPHGVSKHYMGPHGCTNTQSDLNPSQWQWKGFRKV